MPVIRVFSDSNTGEYPSAAVMAVMLGKAQQPVENRSTRRRRMKAESTRPQNPNALTIRQHVFPVRSIERFSNQSGCVSVYDIARQKSYPASPKNRVFCAERAWDQRAEAGYMKQIEDSFQAIIDPIINGQVATVAAEQKPFVDRMFALWYTRSRYRELDQQEYQFKGLVGTDLDKTQEENLEKNGYLFVRKGRKIPARQLNGLELQVKINIHARWLPLQTRWGVIKCQSGEFLVPDAPSGAIIPLLPTLALIGSAEDGMITEENLSEINQIVRAHSYNYYFARDLSKCPS